MRKPVREDKVQRERAPVYTAVYKVNKSDELLAFLLRKCNTSRNNVKSLLTRGQVLVNGSVTTRHDCLLAKDDEVKITKTPCKVDRSNKTPQRKAAAPKIPPLKIVYEDDDFIAVDKPVGLLSVESDKDRTCAFGWVMDYMRARDKSSRPYILHRIDKETSGVLVFAKDIKIHSMLKLRWNDCVSLRLYYAVVQGKMPKAEDTLTCYLKENANNLMYVTRDASGQKAVTKYKVLKEKDGYSLLSVQIETGRKNQIRAQMQALGTPVVGDDKYGDGKGPLGRLGLHAAAIKFTHPVTGEEISVSAPCPPILKSIF